MSRDVEQRQQDGYTQIRASSIRGAGAGIVSVIVQFVVRMCSTILLARLLTPDDFGLVALAAIVLNLFVRVADMGLTTASMQRYRVNHTELSTLFWINVVGGIVLSGIMMATAPLVGLIFQEPRVERVVIVLSLVLATMGLGAQHESLIRRRLEFGRLMAINPISQFMGTVSGVIAALYGVGYWAIVIMNVVTRLSASVGYWCGARWLPGRPTSGRAVLPLLRLGRNLAGAQALIYVTHNLDSAIVGVVGGVADLGLYRRGYNLLQLPIEYCKAQMERLIPASLSRLQLDHQGFQRLYLQGIAALVFIGCPGIGFVVVESPALIRVLLGSHWIDTVGFLRWLSPAALVGLLETSVVWLMIPLGEGRKLLVVRGIRTVSVVLGIIVGQFWGAIGIAAGYGIASVLSFIIEMFYAGVGRARLMWATIDGMWRPILSAAGAGVLVLSIELEPSVVGLAIESALYMITYVGIHILLPGGLTFLRKGVRLLVSAYGHQHSEKRER